VIAQLSPVYLARLASPTGLGDLEPADRAGEVGSVVGGSGVRVTLRLVRSFLRTRVTEAAFRPLGSAAARGPGAVLVERLAGLDVEKARHLRAVDLLLPLGDGLPDAVRRAAGSLIEALGRALDDGDGGKQAADVMAPGVLVCRCLGIGDREIRRAIRRGADDVPAIGVDCAAGTGCHSCWPDLRALLDETRESERAREESPRTKVPASFRDDSATGPEPSAALLLAIDAIIRPLWRAQGIVLRGVRVGAGDDANSEVSVVRLSIASIESQALASPIGAVALARHALRETLCDALRVELDDGATASTPALRPDAR
jgi:bacterioferritin-associated ferredoxin